MVISAANLKTCAQAAHYYEADNYYAKNQGIEHSQWYGKAAQTQGLHNQITPSQFEAALHGQAANGDQLIADRRNRRPGTDITFSAPKSVSLQALVYGKQEIIAAHTKAVQLALDYIERELIQSRLTHNKQTHSERTSNLQAALWLHDTSRNLDPQLHTHAVILNQTQCSDGKWRTIDNSQIFQHQLLVGAIYHNALAHELHQLGYQTHWNPDHTFEISGYTPTQLEAFSTRRAQIIERVGADASVQKRALATLQTRQKKQFNTDRDLLQHQWQVQAQAAGISAISTASPNLPPSHRQPILQTAQAILLHQDSAFSHKQLYREALRQNQGILPPTDIEQDIQRQRLEQQLLLTTDQRYTTPQALQRDRQMIQIARRGQGTQPEISTPEALQQIFQSLTFTPGQQTALELIATTPDRVILVQGDAGTGKTYALSALKDLAPPNTLRGLAPSAAAAQTLETETGIPAQTLDRYLLNTNPSDNQTLIVDEAGLISSRQMLSLLQKAEQTHSRLILIGDTKQLSSIEAGGPFGLLQRSGIPTAFMTEGRRQQDPHLKTITDLAAQGQIAQSYQHLEQTNRITQIPDPEARITAVVQDYLNRSPEDRTQTLLLAGTNAEREAITQAIREGLKAEGSLSPQSLTLEVLKPKYLDTWAKKQATYYELNDTIIFGVNYKHFTQGQPYRVSSIDPQTNSLTLTDSQGQTYNSPCNQHVNRQVYQPRLLELAIGDQGRFTKNSHHRKQINGQPFRVTAINPSSSEITLDTKGWETTFKAQDLYFTDHNYVSTTYAAQGKTQDNVIWCVNTAHPQALGKEAYYVAVSRERHDLKIYTDDPVALRQAILTSRAKTNPSELLPAPSPSSQKPTPATPPAPASQAIPEFPKPQAEQQPKLSSFAVTPKELATAIRTTQELQEIEQLAECLQAINDLFIQQQPAPQLELLPFTVTPADLAAAIGNTQELQASEQLAEPLRMLNNLLTDRPQSEIESWQRLVTPLANAIVQHRDQVALLQLEPSPFAITPADLAAALCNTQEYQAISQLGQSLQALNHLLIQQPQPPEIDTWKHLLTPLAKAIFEHRDQIALDADSQLNQALQQLTQHLDAYQATSLPQAPQNPFDLTPSETPTPVPDPPSQTSVPSHLQEQPLERTQPHTTRTDHPRNLSGSLDHSFDPPAGENQPARIEPHSFRTRARELSEGISRAVEHQQAERLAGAVEELNHHLERCRFSAQGTERLRSAIDRRHQSITDHPQQPGIREHLTSLAAAIEQRAIETDPALSQALTALADNLEALHPPAHREATAQLTARITGYTQQLVSQSLPVSSPSPNLSDSVLTRVDLPEPIDLNPDSTQDQGVKAFPDNHQAQLSLNLGVPDEQPKQSRRQPRSPRQQPQPRTPISPQPDQPTQRRDPDPQETAAASAQPPNSRPAAGTPESSRTPEPIASNPTDPSPAGADPGEIGDWLTELGQWFTDLGQPQRENREPTNPITAEPPGDPTERPDLAGPDRAPRPERSPTDERHPEATARAPGPDSPSPSPDFAGIAQQQADLAEQLRELAQHRQQLAADPAQTGGVPPDPASGRADRHLPGDTDDVRNLSSDYQHNSLDADPSVASQGSEPNQPQSQQHRDPEQATQQPDQHPRDSAATNRAVEAPPQQPDLADLSDQELVNQVLALKQWQKSRPYEPVPSHGLCLKQQIEKLQQRQARYQKVEHRETETLNQLGKPRSLLNPFGPSAERIKTHQDQLRDAQVSLLNIQQELKQARLPFECWKQEVRTYLAWKQNPNTPAMEELAAVIQAPPIQQRLQDINQRQHFHIAAQVILDLQGHVENHSRHFQGQTYRIEERGPTLRIYRKDYSEPIYQAIDSKADNGIVEIQQTRLTPEDREIILENARYLQQQAQEQQQQKQQGRGFSR